MNQTLNLIHLDISDTFIGGILELFTKKRGKASEGRRINQKDRINS